MKKLFLSLFAALALLSCEETIELDIEQAAPVLVIEGLVTNRPGRQFVQLTQTIPVANEQPTPHVSEAAVSVVDAADTEWAYEETAPGYYTPVTPFTGQPGIAYTLHVTVKAQHYTAEEEMQYIPPLDSLNVREDLAEKADSEEEGRFYEALIYGKEPQETTNFYLFKFYRNDTLFNINGSWIFAYGDTLLGENIHALPAPLHYAAAETARVGMYAITRRAYRYYLDLNSNINNDGGMFSGQLAGYAHYAHHYFSKATRLLNSLSDNSPIHFSPVPTVRSASSFLLFSS